MNPAGEAGVQTLWLGLPQGAADERRAGWGGRRFHPVAASGASSAGLVLQMRLALSGGRLPQLD